MIIRMKQEIKTSIYDTFHCIADACPMTCCKGWAIKADGGIYEKWKTQEETAYLCEKVTYRREDSENIYYMKTHEDKTCVLLDEKGLCEIVKRHGDQCLSDTCANFPRKCNELTDETEVLKEYSLSGACPAVMDLLWKRNREEALIRLPENSESSITFPMEYKVRNALIVLLQRDDFSLTEKLLLGFSLLHECLACEWEEEVYDCIEVYQDKENLSEMITLLYKTSYDKTEAFQELCQTFYDVSEFYKQEDMYKPYLYQLADYVEELFPQEEEEETKKKCDDVCHAWQSFKKDFATYDAFFTDVLMSEIFADCVSDDLGFLTEAYQAIALEYIMTRLSVFLKKMIKNPMDNTTTDFETVKRYTSLYIRMIGHNTEGMAEYWEENFEDSVLEKEYFYMILI